MLTYLAERISPVFGALALVTVTFAAVLALLFGIAVPCRDGKFPIAGKKAADDHFNMKVASDGRLFVGIKTSRTSPKDILIGLLVRSPAGAWSPLYNVATFDTLATRPLVLLDESHRRVYFFFSPFHAAINYKTSDMDTIAFPDGVGAPFIASSSVDDINNPSSTKQSITPTSGIEMIASSPGDLSYWHNGLFP